MRPIAYAEFCDLIGKPDTRYFLLLLDGEHSHLGSSSSWAAHVEQELLLVNLTVDEFANLDYGVHPIMVVYRNGREVASHRGAPSYRTFKRLVRTVEAAGR